MAESKRSQDRRIDVRLPPYQHHTLVELAKAHKTSVSVMVRALLKKTLDEIIDERGYERSDR